MAVTVSPPAVRDADGRVEAHWGIGWLRRRHRLEDLYPSSDPSFSEEMRDELISPVPMTPEPVE